MSVGKTVQTAQTNSSDTDDKVNGQFEAPPKKGTPEALESLRDAIAMKKD